MKQEPCQPPNQGEGPIVRLLAGNFAHFGATLPIVAYPSPKTPCLTQTPRTSPDIGCWKDTWETVIVRKA